MAPAGRLTAPVELPDPPPPFPPFPLKERHRIYDSPWVGLRRDIVELPSGAEQEYHVIEIGPAVTVVPELEDGRVLLIGQYRYTHGGTHWELPAGRLEPGESPEQAAVRELREETGHEAARMLPLPAFFPTNGISAHHASAFVAEGCRSAGPAAPEPSELIVPRAFTRGEIEALLDAGSIADAFAALPLLYWLRGTHERTSKEPS